MKGAKYVIRITSCCWISYDIFRLLGMSHQIGILLMIPIWFLLLTLYDDAETERCTKKRQYANRKG